MKKDYMKMKSIEEVDVLLHIRSWRVLAHGSDDDSNVHNSVNRIDLGADLPRHVRPDLAG